MQNILKSEKCLIHEMDSLQIDVYYDIYIDFLIYYSCLVSLIYNYYQTLSYLPVQGVYLLVLGNNSKQFALELPETLRKYVIHNILAGSSLQPHNSMLSIVKGLKTAYYYVCSTFSRNSCFKLQEMLHEVLSKDVLKKYWKCFLGAGKLVMPVAKIYNLNLLSYQP